SREYGSASDRRIDRALRGARPSPGSDTTGLGDGLHALRVRATDLAGNTAATPTASTRPVDTAAPNTTITAQPSDPSNNTTPSFSFGSTETGSTFKCRIDGGSWTPCSSPDSLSPALADGSHTFDVRATDQAGNTDATPATYTWTLDTTAPNTSITAQPSDPSNNTTPSYTGRAHDPTPVTE